MLSPRKRKARLDESNIYSTVIVGPKGRTTVSETPLRPSKRQKKRGDTPNPLNITARNALVGEVNNSKITTLSEVNNARVSEINNASNTTPTLPSYDQIGILIQVEGFLQRLREGIFVLVDIPPSKPSS